jgi:hypothetical protein
MKKFIISLAIITVSFAVNAQETGDTVLRSKKGIPILPQKGDWAIGVDATPFFNYLGNIFNNTSNNSLNFGDYTIYARYFIADNAAVNFILTVDNTNSLSKQRIQDDAAVAADPNSTEETFDTYKEVDIYKSLGIAYQKFRGYGRLKGYYGFQASYWTSRYKEIYTYGNPMTLVNPNPSMVWDSNNDNRRILNYDGGFHHGISAGLIAGVEYFFAPKISAGFNVTLSATHSWRSQSNYKYERVNPAGNAIEEYDQASTPKGRTYTSLFTNVGGNFDSGIYLMFHF